MTTPIQFLREAVQAVPAVKYALGIGGIVATIAITYSFKLDPRVSFVGAIVMIVLMSILVIFARMSSLASHRLALPTLVFTWFTLLLFVAVSLSLFTSVFYQKPLDLSYWLTPHGLPLDKVSREPEGSKIPKPLTPPSKWQEFRGFNNLSGTWRGESADGMRFQVEVPPQDGEEVIATFTAERLNCRIVTKLVKATDDQLTTSNYFFRPTTTTAGCPDVESIMLRPFDTMSDFRMTYANGKSWDVRILKRV